jgi:hypothetical protein
MQVTLGQSFLKDMKMLNFLFFIFYFFIFYCHVISERSSRRILNARYASARPSKVSETMFLLATLIVTAMCAKHSE